MNLHPFQLATNREVWREFQQGRNSVLLQAPTGSGKTVMGSHLIKMRYDHMRERCVVFAHRREIVRQTEEKLRWAGLEPEIVMAGHAPNPWSNVGVASKDTVWARNKRGLGLPESQFVVVDEAHTIGAKGKYNEIIRQYLSQGAKVLGLSATPIRKDGYGLGSIFESMVRAPDVPWLIQNGFLCRPRYFTGPPVSTKGLGRSQDDFNPKLVEERMQPLVGDVVDNWLALAQGRPTMIFASGVSHSMSLVEQFKEKGVAASHVDGETANEIRDDVFRASRSTEVQIISNAQVYIEGADFPWISCVVLATITKSLVRYLQMAGRGLRTCDGKADLYLIDHGGNFDRHGPADLNRDWQLTSEDGLQAKLEEKRKKEQKLQVRCPRCGFMHSQRQCPLCHAQPKEAKDVEFIEAMLKETTYADWEARKAGKTESADMQAKEHFYAQLLGYAESRGYKTGFADHAYRSRFGVWPHRKSNVRPEAPSAAVLKFIQHRNIRRAHSR